MRKRRRETTPLRALSDQSTSNAPAGPVRFGLCANRLPDVNCERKSRRRRTDITHARSP